MDWRTKKPLKSKIPEGERGNWKVEKFTVSESDSRFEEMRALMHGSRRFVPPGTYTRLMCRGRGVIMSDTPDELRDFHRYVLRMSGSVLINGLGLGCVVQELLAKPDVTEVTVIEKEADVIALVAPHLADPRLTVIHADAYEWTPPKGKRWNFVWHDIWDNIVTDNLKGMSRLHRKYGRRCDEQRSWQREELLYMRRREQRQDDFLHVLGGRF